MTPLPRSGAVETYRESMLAACLALVACASCGEPEREALPPESSAWEVVERRPVAPIFAPARTSLILRTCGREFDFDLSLDVLSGVHEYRDGGRCDAPGVENEELGDIRRRFTVGGRMFALLDRNPCRRDISTSYCECAIRDPVPGGRLEVRTLSTAVTCARTTEPTASAARCDGFVALLDGAFEPKLMVLDRYVVLREDGTMTWRGFETDDAGRVVEVWVVDPERSLRHSHSDWLPLARLQRREGASAWGCPSDSGYAARYLAPELRAPERHASVRLRWYDGLDAVSEIWGEVDGLREGLYVFFDPHGTPLVIGDHALGVRHGLWYYFGFRDGRETLVAAEDYFFGEVTSRWEAPLDVDPLADVIDTVDPDNNGPRPAQ